MDKGTRSILWLVVAILVIWGGYMLAQRQAPAEESAELIRVGFMAPLTGGAASYGESVKRGVDLARKELGPENVAIIYEDSKCEPKDAVNAINKLVNIDHVVAIIGELCSGATLAAAPVATENKVLMVSAGSTSPKITDEQYVYRTLPSDALQGDFGANLVYDKGYRKIAVLYTNEEYGLGFNDVLSEKFAQLGGEVVASESFARDATDMRTQITKVKAASPDAIYIISNNPAASVAVLKQIKDLALEAALFGSEGLKDPSVTEGAGEASEGLTLTTVSSGTSGFIEKHNAEYGEDPGPFAAQAYDAYTAIAKALESGAENGEQIKEALSSLEFDGASGNITFDENGDVNGMYDVFVVKDEKYELAPQ